MNKKWVFYLAIAIFVVDQITKILITKFMLLGDVVSIIPNYIDLHYITNRGVAFGLLSGGDAWWRPVLFFGAAIFAAIMLYVIFLKTDKNDKYTLVATGLLWGGIAGNILDRIRYGSVVDFISLHFKDIVINESIFGKMWHIPLVWPSFNVADSAITIAVVILLIVSLKGSKI